MLYQAYQLWTGARPVTDAKRVMKLVFAVTYLDLFDMAVWAGYFNDVLSTQYSQTLFPGYAVSYGYSFIFVIISWVLGFISIGFLFQLSLIGSGKHASGENNEGQPDKPLRGDKGNTNTTSTQVSMNTYNTTQPSQPAAYVAPPLTGNGGGGGSFRGPGGAPPPLAPRPAQHTPNVPSTGRAFPARPPHGRAASGGLPPNWSEQKSSKNEVYYFNSVTNESRWEKPTA